MEVLYVASEVAPFSKTGGLADVTSALPRALAARGHRMVVVTPLHRGVDASAHGLVRLPVAVEALGERASVLESRGPVRVLFLEHEGFYGSRAALYDEDGVPYPDNAERFAFLTRAALALPRRLGLRPRVVHLNDWQTALGAFLLRRELGGEPALSGARSLYTVHNLAYQGVFPREKLPAVGLPAEVFHWQSMEFHGHLNFMKAGLLFADALTTVSPTYAREILGPEQGCGLESVLRGRAADLHGILNGIDTVEWDPRRDPHLPARYGPEDLSGKAACKAALQEELGLPARPRTPLVGMVTRLAEQKGIELVEDALPEILSWDVQLAILGSGSRSHELFLEAAARERPDRLAARIGFDEGLAHRIEAGADLFLMPSRFEPCGLNQMYSLRYGTAPVVRAVGGLEDTVEDYDGRTRGTGFKFGEYRPEAMRTALRRAVDVYRDERAFRGIVERGMAVDSSWDARAERYEALYRSLAPED